MREKIKPKDNSNSRRRRIPAQKPQKYFNKIQEENFPDQKKEMSINEQEAYRTTNTLDQKRKFPCHFTIKTRNIEDTERILKAIREKAK